MGALPSPCWTEGFGVRVPGDPLCRPCAGTDSRRAGDLPHRRGSPPAEREGRVLEKLIIQKTLRVPASTGGAGDSAPVARQLDAALLDVGFSASRALLEHV